MVLDATRICAEANDLPSFADTVVDQLPRLLHRTPDAVELDGFVAAMEQGMTEQQVDALILGSAEYFDDVT